MQGIPGYYTLNGRLVCPWDTVSGVCQPVREIAVICQKQQSKGIEIKTANRIDPLRDALEELGNNRPSLGVFERTYIAEGFIQYKVDPVGRFGYLLSIYPDAVLPPGSL